MAVGYTPPASSTLGVQAQPTALDTVMEGSLWQGQSLTMGQALCSPTAAATATTTALRILAEASARPVLHYESLQKEMLAAFWRRSRVVVGGDAPG